MSATGKLAALRCLSEAWGPHSEDGKLTGWAASEIERLDADACNERSERESWQAIAKTRESERDQLRAVLLKHACYCGPMDPDPGAHREGCEYRRAFQLSGDT